MQEEDADAVLAIYAQGITGGNATFETEVPEWKVWDNRHRPDCRLVARSEDNVVGWAALSPVSARAVYRGVAEISVYVSPASQGQGVGKQLVKTLIQVSTTAGIWTLQASIFPENLASQALFEACGFRVVGYRERIAQLSGRWRNTMLLEKRLDV